MRCCRADFIAAAAVSQSGRKAVRRRDPAKCLRTSVAEHVGLGGDAPAHDVLWAHPTGRTELSLSCSGASAAKATYSRTLAEGILAVGPAGMSSSSDSTSLQELTRPWCRAG